MQQDKLENQVNWYGEFSDKEKEKQFRKETWGGLTERLGKVVLITGGFFLIAGLLEYFYNDERNFLLFTLRGLASFWAGFIFFSKSNKKLKKYLVPFISVYILFLGVIESYGAVLNYKPGIEMGIPFTLLIIMLIYLLFPLAIKGVAPASVVSSLLYLSVLYLYTSAEWGDFFQLTVFFAVVNIIGIYIFIELSKNRRYKYLSYNEINKLYSLLNSEIIKKGEANKQLSVLAETDDLTGIYNRRKFFTCINSEFTKSVRYKRPMSLLMIDIDYFKKVNDTYGHDAGDIVITEFTERCRQELRQSDVIARIGGEEFAVILPETSEEGAYILAERIRNDISEKEFVIKENRLSITSSCGVVSIESSIFKNVSDFIKAADNALYMAKQSGRNKSCISTKGIDV